MLHLNVLVNQSACIQCVESHSEVLWIWVVGIYIGLDRLLTIQKLPVINGHSSHPANELKIRQVVLITQTRVGVDLQGVVVPATFTQHIFKDIFEKFFPCKNVFSKQNTQESVEPFHRQNSVGLDLPTAWFLCKINKIK